MCSFSSPWVIKVEQKSEVVLLFLLTLLLPVLCFKPGILENTLMLSVTIIVFPSVLWMGVRRCPQSTGPPRGLEKSCTFCCSLTCLLGEKPHSSVWLGCREKPEPSPSAGAGLWQRWQPGLRSEEVLSEGHPPGRGWGGEGLKQS